MPAASWPRCCRACRPSAVMAAASGWPKMPNTPHSSRSRSPSRSRSGIARFWSCMRSRSSRLAFAMSVTPTTCSVVAKQRRRESRDRSPRRRVRAPARRPSAASTASRWCFRGRPATSTSASRRFPCSTTFDLASLTQFGWLFSGTSQAKNRKATTTMTRPRASPNRKPSVRSSAPTRLSRTMSEIRMVMIETMISVPRKTPPITAAPANMSLLKYCFACGSSLG